MLSFVGANINGNSGHFFGEIANQENPEKDVVAILNGRHQFQSEGTCLFYVIEIHTQHYSTIDIARKLLACGADTRLTVHPDVHTVLSQAYYGAICSGDFSMMFLLVTESHFEYTLEIFDMELFEETAYDCTERRKVIQILLEMGFNFQRLFVETGGVYDGCIPR